ncbi:hypothetical protein [Hymenobacter koreensis]|uniref:Peptidase M19 n=1 Tax=Hymenobacter koreensis TaxID=1084523 RepID=A0ABP8IYU5_9BACT
MKQIYLSLLGIGAAGCVGLKVPSNISSRYPVDSTRSGYVDFHNHTTMKPYTAGVQVPKGTPDDQVAAQQLQAARHSNEHLAWTLNTRGERKRKKEGAFSSFAGYRQSQWGALGTYRLICTSLYGYERGLVDDARWFNRFIKSVGRRIGIGLPAHTRRELRNPYVTAFDDLQAEYAFLQRQAKVDPEKPREGEKIKLIKSAQEIRQLSPGQTGLVLSIEGGHALFGPQPRLDKTLLVADTKAAYADQLKANISTLKQWEHPVMFVTLSHLIWNKLSGHGKGTDIEGSPGKLLHWLSRFTWFREGGNTMPATGITGISGFSADEPKPYTVVYDNGLAGSTSDDPQGLGKLVVEQLLDKKNGRILIDIRHSGIKTRLEYYTLLKHRRAQGDHIPIMVSHAAMSGKSLRFALATALRPRADNYAEFKNPAAFYEDEFRRWKTPSGLDTLSPTLTLSTHPGSQVIRSLLIAKAGFSIENTPYFYRDFFKPQPLRRDTLTYLRASEVPTPAQHRAGYFQPSSINLADEEVDIICQSDGLIGLTVEQRALGTRLPEAWQERLRIHKLLTDSISHHLKSGVVNLPAGVSPQDFIDRFVVVAPFVRNLSHMVHAASPASDVWRHIAIGTDFDGVIDPLDYFHTSDRLGQLEQFVHDHFELYDRYYPYLKLRQALANTPTGKPYPKQQALRQLFSENGSAFILKYYPSR